MHEAWQNGELENAMKIDKMLMPLHEALFSETSPGPVKFAASKLGLCSYELRLPLTNISKNNENRVLKALDKLNLNNKMMDSN